DVQRKKWIIDIGGREIRDDVKSFSSRPGNEICRHDCSIHGPAQDGRHPGGRVADLQYRHVLVRVQAAILEREVALNVRPGTEAVCRYLLAFEAVDRSYSRRH